MEITIGGDTVKIDISRVKGDAEAALEQYLQGEPVEFDHPVDLGDLSPFNRKILEEVRKIPYGETRTYQEVADMFGNPGAVQAIGQACKNNPVPIIIPCHRVVAEDGIGGYKYGEDVKRALLEMEDAL
ncbi:MAG: methylated-DNA--[protein]-cysteine S-methyltransferase [Candidatus Nanohaloarchaea archaeon]|nr:methylated-DNA--[protein]-cysteine S-methyltransferase [Candidatus Nanohaloarchaea archaeon]